MVDSFLANLISTITLAICRFFLAAGLDALPEQPLLLDLIPLLIFSFLIEGGFLRVRRNKPNGETAWTVTIANLIKYLGIVLKIILGGSLPG